VFFVIRLKPFDRISYQKLRIEYLNKLVDSRAIAFDPSDIFLEGERPETTRDRATRRTTKNTRKKLNESNTLFPLKKYLFNGDSTVSKDHLRLLLAGPEPENMPKSFGGNGKYNTMREVFEEIIKEIGEIRKPKAAQSKEQAGPEVQANLEGWNICKNIFSYQRLSYTSTPGKNGTQEEIGTSEKTAYWLQQQLHMGVCPFCNRIPTSTPYTGTVRASFDHFFPKSVYPYLAISLFNLIPICDVCNNNKSDDAEVFEASSIIYPYDESFDESMEVNPPAHVSFHVAPKEWEALYGKSDQFTIQFQPTDETGKILKGSRCGVGEPADLNMRFPFRNLKYWKRVKNSITLLKLEDLYDTHKNEIMRILRNRYQYNRTAIEFSLRTFLSTDSPLHKTNDSLLLEVRNMLYFANLDPDDWGLAPLNKLKADILKQMDMLEMLRFDEDDFLGGDEKHG